MYWTNYSQLLESMKRNKQTSASCLLKWNNIEFVLTLSRKEKDLQCSYCSTEMTSRICRLSCYTTKNWLNIFVYEFYCFFEIEWTTKSSFIDLLRDFIRSLDKQIISAIVHDSIEFKKSN